MRKHFTKAILFLFLTLIFKSSVAQGSRSFLYSEEAYVTFSLPRPHDFDKPDLLMKKGVRQETVYMYLTKGKQIDSELVVTTYFDSAGLRLERDDYDSN